MTFAAPDPALGDLYRDLHAHPELSFQETRTAGIVASYLSSAGYDVTPGVGRTGVVGVLRNGVGPTALLRADMDALPVREQTGLPYASRVTGTDDQGRTVPVAHACGHDLHVACLLGAAAELAANTAHWQGTLMVVFQPAEELARGARAMIDDGLFDRFPTPDVVLGQHVSPLPAGAIGLRAGTAFAASDSLSIKLRGAGGHGSRPEATVDPVVMSAALVMRLQGIVAREVAATDVTVVTVGSLHAGTKANIIADEAELELSVRTVDPAVRARVLAAIERIAHAEAAASGTDARASVTIVASAPTVDNDADACATTSRAWGRDLPQVTVVDPGLVTGSEDVGLLASASGAACVYWLLGGADPAHFADATSAAEVEALARSLPSNHSPHYAPVAEPTIRIGVPALVSAAHCWLQADGS